MMSGQASDTAPSAQPSIAAYNIRFLSLSQGQEEQWKAKIANTRYLVRQFTMVALLETHVGESKADFCFCRHIDGVTRLYADGFAVLVQSSWAETHRPVLHVVVPDAMVAVCWEISGINHFAFFLRLDAFSERTRSDQLARASQWARDQVGAGHWVVFAGDRNFVRTISERQSASQRRWCPSERMNRAWDAWLQAIGNAEEVQQPEFTWGRVVSNQRLGATWTYEVLDVAGTNAKTDDGTQAFARRCDDVPHPRISDHWPVGLRWRESKGRKRGCRPSDERIVKRAIPQWLLDDADFLSSMDNWFDEWWANRAAGMAGLDSFVFAVHSLASRHLSSRVVPAKTPLHRLELALAAVRLLKEHPVDERRLARLCMADPELEGLIELVVDIERPGYVSVSQEVIDGVAARCKEQADRVISETSTSAESSPEVLPGFGDHHQSESTLTRLKKLKQGKRSTCCELWDDEGQCFTSDNGRMAEIIQQATMERQGSPRGHAFAGQGLLDEWQANFSRCRTSIQLHEIETIILDGPNGKQPGPDGVPASVVKRYARRLAIMFQEAWAELCGGHIPDEARECLGRKKWIVIPKVEGANVTGKLRDLESGNEVRKVLARILFKVLDEVCADKERGLPKAQQAFIKGRDIMRNTTMICRNFWSANGEAVDGDDPFITLALDCSKGYNCMDHYWTQRCLEKACLPQEVINVVNASLINMPVLLLGGYEHDPLELVSGLTQGCPASCVLYVIAVDPMLAALQRIPRLKGVSGFVDDWSMGCCGVSVVAEVSALMSDFERASGQRLNREKSAAIPARTLSSFEQDILFAAWGSQIRVSYHERVLGVDIGLHVRIDDQYVDAMKKFEAALAVFSSIRARLSLAIRLVVINVFLLPLFSYLNRQFFMPSGLLRNVEGKMLAFLTPVSWSKLGMFSAVGKVYGLQVSLRDLRLANVASVLATYEALPDLEEGTATVLARWRRRHTQLANPAISWKVAFDFYVATTGVSYKSTLNASFMRTDGQQKPFRALYRQLADSELPRWRDYLKQRVMAKGWDGDLLLRGLRRLPRSLSQAHRWFLLKLHLNAPVTSARMAVAGVAIEDVSCAFCRTGDDSVGHISRCPAVLAAYDAVSGVTLLPPLLDARSSLMLQEDWDGATVAGIIAVFSIVWDIRSMCRRGVSYGDHDGLVDLVWTCVQCPWLARCCPTRTKRQRRGQRVREPDVMPCVVIYRSDGASRGQGRAHETIAGWGAAVWSATESGRGSGPPFAVARGFLGNNVSNNVAEYEGLRACMRRALRIRDLQVAFEVDSMLLARQMAHHRPWACRSENLLAIHVDCVGLGERLSELGVSWRVRHIYREFNQTADTLSNQAIDEQDTNGHSANW